MTKISFIHGAPDRLQGAAGWLGSAWKQRRPVLVFVPQAPLAERMNQLLWTQPALGFLPHCPADSPLAAETPILLTRQLDTLPQDKLLLNLSDDVPQGFSRFEELVEIVSTADDDRLLARDRAKFYKERGYEVSFTPWEESR